MASHFQDLLAQFAPEYARYEAIYSHIHANAELSWQEQETADLVAKTLQQLSLDMELKQDIGGTTGLFAVLGNGPGKTVLLRADMDALPVKELTGLDYASKKEMKDSEGHLQPTMHACGHDMHVAALLAAADILVSSQSTWAGTVVFLFQPAEEKMAGARALVDSGLYTTYGCPVPDVVLGQHVSTLRAGSIATRSGTLMAGTDGLVIKVFGRGAHGSMPHLGVDPVLLASHIVVKLQSIVSREIPPGELAVVTVGAISAGIADNIISEEATLKVNVRSVSPHWRDVILQSIRRMVRAECTSANCPRDPTFEVVSSSPPVVNDHYVTTQLSETFTAIFGSQYNPEATIATPSEDFAHLAVAVNKPSCFWALGGHDPVDFDQRAKDGTLSEIPVNHSPYYAPAIQPTLKTGAEALVAATWTFLAKTP